MLVEEAVTALVPDSHGTLWGSQYRFLGDDQMLVAIVRNLYSECLETRPSQSGQGCTRGSELRDI